MDEILNIIAGNIWVGIPLAVVAGILSAFAPCSISSLSILIGYNEVSKHKGKTFLRSLFFCIGLAVTTTAFMIILGELAEVLETWLDRFSIIIGLGMLILALDYFGVPIIPKHRHKIKNSELNDKNEEIIKENCEHNKEHKHSHENHNECVACDTYERTNKDIWGSFTFGLLAGILCAPCLFPIYSFVIINSAVSGMWYGILIYTFFLIGHTAVILIASLLFSKLQGLLTILKNEKFKIAVRIIIGFIFVLVAVLLICVGIFGE